MVLSEYDGLIILFGVLLKAQDTIFRLDSILLSTISPSRNLSDHRIERSCCYPYRPSTSRWYTLAMVRLPNPSLFFQSLALGLHIRRQRPAREAAFFHLNHILTLCSPRIAAAIALPVRVKVTGVVTVAVTVVIVERRKKRVLCGSGFGVV
jgi:hypothetical protein